MRSIGTVVASAALILCLAPVVFGSGIVAAPDGYWGDYRTLRQGWLDEFNKYRSEPMWVSTTPLRMWTNSSPVWVNGSMSWVMPGNSSTSRNDILASLVPPDRQWIAAPQLSYRSTLRLFFRTMEIDG